MHDSQRMREQILPKPEMLLEKRTAKRKPRFVPRKFLCCRETFASEKNPQGAFFKHIYTFLASCGIRVSGFRQGQLKIKGEEVQSSGPNLRSAETKDAGTARDTLHSECLPFPSSS